MSFQDTPSEILEKIIIMSKPVDISIMMSVNKRVNGVVTNMNLPTKDCDICGRTVRFPKEYKNSTPDIWPRVFYYRLEINDLPRFNLSAGVCTTHCMNKLWIKCKKEKRYDELRRINWHCKKKDVNIKFNN